MVFSERYVGHNLCYTPEVKLGDIFGEKFKCTHLHDNDGVFDKHLLPFDGSNNWQEILSTLKNYDYKGTLNLELSCNGSQQYNSISYIDFVHEAFGRAIRLKGTI